MGKSFKINTLTHSNTNAFNTKPVSYLTLTLIHLLVLLVVVVVVVVVTSDTPHYQHINYSFKHQRLTIPHNASLVLIKKKERNNHRITPNPILHQLHCNSIVTHQVLNNNHCYL